jgi:hypothetical protein
VILTDLPEQLLILIPDPPELLIVMLVAPAPLPCRVQEWHGGVSEEVQAQLPGGTATVSPSEAALSAVCMSACEQEAALIAELYTAEPE